VRGRKNGCLVYQFVPCFGPQRRRFICFEPGAPDFSLLAEGRGLNKELIVQRTVLAWAENEGSQENQ
ncbi:MAG: hypothetical protein AAFR93_17325, partial [Pseudomonadota bacterium]